MNIETHNLIGWTCVALFAFNTKYIDDVRDEDVFGGTFILPSLILANISACAAILFSPTAYVLLVAIAIGCLFAGKVDIWEFRFVTVVVVLFALIIALTNKKVPMIELCLWSMLAFFDEILNKISDKMQPSKFKALFKNKPLMPLTALALVIVMPSMWERLVILVIFDVSYLLVPISKGLIKKIDPVKQACTESYPRKKILVHG